MYDGAAAATAHHADHHHEPGHRPTEGGLNGALPPPTSAPAQYTWTSSTGPSSNRDGRGHADWATDSSSAPGEGLRPGDTVVFIDSQIVDHQAIVAAIDPGVKVIVYDGTQDGLAEIAQDLQGVHGLASIDIISPGGSDAVQVGTDTLTTNSISTYSADLTAIGKALSPHGQLDLYGGDVAGSGDDFLATLQQATGRNVAASTGPVGATALGGTWTLDATTGPTPDALPANLTELQSFDGLLANPAGLGPGDQVVFVDSQITDYQAIVAAINPGVTVVVYDGTQDGLAQIAQDLQGAYDLAAVDIISHGAVDQVQIGTDTLSTGSISTYSADLAAIGNALAPTGQLDLYGCDVAAAGDGFLTALQQATGRNVAASTDPIGASALGGTWTLDASTGPTPDVLPANFTAIQSFDGLLLSVVATLQNQNAPGTDSFGELTNTITIGGTATDSAGDIFVVGTFQGTVNFGGTTKTSSAGTDGDTFVVKYNSSGTLQWVDDFGSTANNATYEGTAEAVYADNGVAIAVTPSGSTVYVGGTYYETIDFNNGLSTSLGTGANGAGYGYSGGYVVQLAGSTGLANWDIVVHGSSSATDANVVALATDSSGNVFVAETIDADGANVTVTPATGSSYTPPQTGDQPGGLIFEASSSGALEWHATIIDTQGGGDYITGLAIDSSDNVYVVGELNDAAFTSESGASATVGTPTFVVNVNHTNYTVRDYGAFIAELNSSGNFQWEDAAASSDVYSFNTYSPLINAVAVDQYGPVVTGLYYDDTVIDGTTLHAHRFTRYSSSQYSSSRVFVEQFNTSGAAKWLLTESDNGQQGIDQGTNILVDAAGDIVVGGTIASTSTTADNFAGKSISPPGGTLSEYRSEAFVWDIAPGSSSATTNFVGDFTSSTYDAIGGLFALSGGGAGVALDITGTATANLDSATASAGVSGDQAGVLFGASPSNLGESSPPTITAGTPSVTFDGGSTSAVKLDSGLTITAGNSSTLASATVSIASGDISGDDILNFTNQNGITGSYNAGTGTLTLSGTASVTNYQAALDSITYSFSPTNGNPTGSGSDTSRTIDWVVNDGTSNSNTGSTTLNVVHEPPTVTASGTVTFDSGGSAVQLDSTLTVGDVDSGGTLAGATVSIAAGFATGDTLNFTTQNGISGSFSGSALTLTGSATVAQYQTALQSITFSTTSATAGNRTIDWSVKDSSTSNGTSTTATSTVTVHGKPVVTAGATATFDGGGGPVVLDSSLTVTDASSATLSTATISIGTGFISGDTLGFTNTNATAEGNITASYNAATGVLTLTSAAATATVAQWQTALDSISYSFSPTNGDPTAGGADTARTIDWAVNDGTVSSLTATSTLNTTHVAPTVTAGATATFDGGGSAVTLDGGLTVSDPDSSGTLASATVTIVGAISGDSDTLSFTNNGSTEGNIAISTNVNGQLVLTSAGASATVAQWQAALDSVTYSFNPTNGDPTGGGSNTSRTIDWVVNDGVVNSTTKTSTLDTVHVAPTIAAGATAIYETGGPAAVLDSAITLTDVDSGGNLTGATVTIGTGFISADDTLNFTNRAHITGSYNSGTGVLTLSGSDTVADYQAALDSITFSTTTTAAGSRAIDWSVKDGSTSNGTSATATSTVNVQVGPDVTAGATASFTGGGAAVTLDGALTVSDIASADLQSATVSIGSGFVAGDILNFTNQNNITGSYNAGTGVLTLSGRDTLADYRTALESITYSFSPGDGDPTGGGSHTTRTIDWSANDGTANSSPVTSTLDVTHVAPSVTAGAIATFEIGSTTPLSLDGGLTVTDIDSGGNLTGATVTIGGSVAGDTLNFTSLGNIAGSYNAGTGVLTLSGTDTVADYQTALESITFSTIGTSAVSHTVDWTVADGVANSAGVTSTVNEALGPQVTAGATVTYDGGGNPVTLDAGLTLADSFSATLTGATVTIGGFVTGDTLTINGTTSGSIDNGSNGTIGYTLSGATLTLTGADTVADYQAALRSIAYSSTGDPTKGGTEFSRAVSYSVTDSYSVTSAAATSTLDTYGAPVLTGGGGTVDFTQGGAAVTLENNFAVSDVNGLTVLSGATVSISGDFATGDTLDFSNQNGITGSYNAGTGVLTLSGSSSLAHYVTALDSVTFATTAPIPFGSAPTRTISWTVNDDAGSESNPSVAVASTVDLLHTDSAPVLGSDANTVLATEQTPVVLDSLATVSDAELDSLNSGLGDYGGASLTIARTGGANSHDIFGFQTATDPNGGNLVLSGNTVINQTSGDAIATFTSTNGTLTLTFTDAGETVTTALANTVLENITYNNTGTAPPASAALDWTFSDGNTGAQGAGGAMTAAGTTAVDITAVNQAPVATITDATYSATADASLNLKNTGLSVSDVDGGSGSETATLSVGEGVLTVTAGTSGATVSNSGTSAVTINGTTAQIEALLNTDGTSTVSYVDNAATPAASTTLALSIDDNGNTGSGGALTARATATIDVSSSPVVTAAATATFEVNGAATTLDSNLTVTDASSSTIASATVSIGTGFVVGDDALNFTNQNGIAGSYDSTSGVLTLTGSDTLAHYQAALDSITFSTSASTAGTPRTIDWVVNDGIANSAQATSTVDVATGPTVTAGATVTYALGGGVVALDSGLVVTDSGVSTLTTATVSIGTGFVTSEDALNFTNQGNITGSYDATTGRLTLSGVDTVADYQAALESVSFSTTATSTSARTIDWAAADGVNNSATATSTVDITEINQAPMATITNSTYSATEGVSLNLKNSGLSVSDADSAGGSETATLSVGEGVLTVAAGGSGATVTNSGTSTVTINGTTAQIDALLKTDGTSTVTYIDNNTDPSANTVLTLSIDDNGHTGAGGALTANANATIDIAAVNNPPVLSPSTPTAVTYVEGETSPVALLSSGSVSDPDLPADFVNGSVAVAISAGSQSGDEIVLLSTSPFHVSSGSLLDASNNTIGTISGLGTASASLTGLTAFATPTVANELVEAFGFQTTSTNTSDRTIQLTFNDGGNTGSGGAKSVSVSQTVHIGEVIDGQLWIGGNGTPTADNRIESINSDGTGATVRYLQTSLTSEDQAVGLGNFGFISVTLDTADDLWFGLGNDEAITVGRISTGAVIQTLQIGSLKDQDLVDAFVVDPAHDVIYVSLFGANYQDSGQTGSAIIKVTYNPTTGVMTSPYDPTANTDLGSTSIAASGILIDSESTSNVYGMARSMWLSPDGSTLYYVDDNDGDPGSYWGFKTNGIFEVSTTASNPQPVMLTSQSQFPTTPDGNGNYTNGYITGMTVDTAKGLIYFTTDSAAEGVNTSQDALWYMPITGGTATKVSGVTLDYPAFFASNITLDPTSQTLYIADYETGDVVQVALNANGESASSVNSDFYTWDSGSTSAEAEGVTFDAAPTLSVTSADPTYTEQQSSPASVALLSSAAAADADNGYLAGATVTISSGFLSGVDQLSIDGNASGSISNSGHTITYSYSSGTGVMTLTGVDTVADYNAALRLVDFQATGNNPTNYGADLSRTLTWSITDGFLSNQIPVTTTMTVVGVNDAPVATITSTTYSATADLALSLKNDGLSVSDVDGGTGIETATLSVGEGTLTVTAGSSGATVIGSDSSSVTIDGTVAEINALLNTNATSTVSYIDTNANPAASATLTLLIDDNGNAGTGGPLTGTATATIDIASPPAVTAGTTVTFDAGGSPVVLDSSLTATDTASTTLASATVTITDDFQSTDVLAIPSADLTSGKITGTNIAESYNSGTGVLTLSGTDTLAHYQTALRDVTFSSTAPTPSTAPRTITFAVNDGVSSGSGTATVDIVDQPVVTAGATATFDDGSASTVPLDSNLTIGDPSSATLASASVSIVSAVTGDTLSINGATSGAITDAGGTINYLFSGSTLALSGADTVADYQAALRSVGYGFSPTGGDPTNGGGETSRTIDWSVNDGTLNSATATSTLDLVHQAPTVSAGGFAVFDGGGSAITLDSGVAVNDVGGSDLASATVQIVGSIAGDTLMINGTTSGAITDAGGTINYLFSGSTLSLSGTDTAADYGAALDLVTYSFTASGDPTGGGSHTTRTIDWTVSDGFPGSGTSATATSMLDTVHEAPTVSAGASVTFDGGSSALALDGGITVSDVDSGNMLTGATISIVGYVNGDTLNFTAQNNITVASNSGGVLTLTGSDTVADYQTALRSITYSVSPSDGDPTDGGGHNYRVIDWSVNDGAATSATATSTLDTVHVAPTLAASGTVTYLQAASAATLDGTLSLSDPDSGGLLTGATVQISSGFLNGDTLSATTTGLPSITASYNSATGELTLSGSDTLADYQAVLRSVAFSSTSADPTDNGIDPSRTVTWAINDGVSTNPTPETSTVDVHGSPSVTAGGTVTFDGGGTAVALDPSLTVTAPSSSTLASATVTIGTGYISGDTLNFTNNGSTEGNIAGSYSAGMLTLTSSGDSATVAQWQAALQAVTYSFTSNGDPTGGGGDTARTISWTVSDGVLSSSAATSTLDTLHEAPVVTATATVAYGIGGSPTLADSTLTVTDADSGGNLTGATVSIGNGFVSGGALNFTDQNGISGSYDASTGILALSGTASVADYQTALDSITFSTTATAPGTRTIEWAVTDGSTTNGASATVAAATNTIDLVLGPGVTTAGPATFTGGGPAVVLNGALTVDDPFSTTLSSATITIVSAITGDTLNFTNAGSATEGNIAVQSDAAGVLVLTSNGDTATLSQWQTALESVTYSFTPSDGDPTGGGTHTTRTVDWVINDGSTNSNTATSTLDLVHVAPTVTAGAAVTYETGSPMPLTLDSGLTVNDVDSGGILTGATVSISGFVGGSGDALNFTNTPNIVGSYNSGTGVLTLSGNDTLADYQTALESIAFSTTGTNSGTRTIDWTVSDSAATSAQATSSVTVEPGPQVTASATATFYGGGSPAPLDPGLTLTDTSSATLASATVSIGGLVSGDTLNFTNTANISGSYNSTTGVLTLIGSDTVADYQAALESITYSFSPSNGDPTAAGTQTTRTIDWTVNDGVASSATATSTLDTVHVAPSVTAGATASYGIGGSAVVVDSGLAVTDLDSGGTLSSATITIGTGFLSGDDRLNFTNNGTTEGDIGIASNASGTLVLTSPSDTATLAQWDAALASVTFSTSSTTPGVRTIDWTVADEASTSLQATSTVDIVVGPQVTASATATFAGGGTPVVLDGTLSVTDPASTTLASATVTVAGAISGDTLNFTNTGNTAEGNIAVQSDAGGVLVLTSSGSTATLAQWQTAIESVTYSFNPSDGDPTAGGSNTSRTIDWVVNDGTNSNSPATSTLDLVHTAPTVTAGATATFLGGGAPVTLDGALSVSDADSDGNLSSASVTITSGFLTGDTLSANTAATGITASYNAANGVLTLSGEATLANYQSVLDSVTYSFSPTHNDPTGGGGDTSRIISWVANDGVVNSSTAISSVDTVHVAPTVTPSGATVTFDGGGAAVALDGALTVSDPDSADTLVGATVSISSGFLTGDALNFSNQNGITGGYNAVTGVLTLSGSATVAQYQTALDSITYSFAPTNGDPTGGGADTTRTISWVANDGVASNTPATSTIDIVHVAPTVTAGATATFTGGGSAVTLDGAVTVSDVDSSGSLTGATVTISSGFIGGDLLNFSTQNGIAGSYNAGTGVLTLNGTASVANYQTALDSITYSFTPTNGDPTGGGGDTARTVSWVVDDLASSSAAATSTLDAVHVAPTAVAGATVTFDGGGPAVTLDGTLTIGDIDSGGKLTGASVTISSGFISGDTLNFANQNGISGSYNASTGVLTLSGTTTLANYQTALDSITYSLTPTNGDPTSGGGDTARTISWVVNDRASSSTAATSTLDLVHEPPTVTAGTPSVTFVGGGPAVTLDSALTVNDPDSGGNLTGATVTIGTGLLPSDVLSFNNGTNTETFGSDTIIASFSGGTLTLTGTATLADYQTALQQVQFRSFGNGDPTGGGGDTARTVSWVVNDGSTSNGVSTTGTSTLDTVHVAPTVTAGGTVTFIGGGSAVTLDSTLAVSDVDSAGNLAGATVSISSGFIGGDTLNFTNQSGITGSYDAVHGILTLSGTASLADYQTALDSIAYSFSPTNGDPTGGGGDTARTVSWVVNDGSTSNGVSTTGTSTLDTVHVAPTVTAGGTVTFIGGGSAVTLDSTLAVADVDSAGNLAGATVSISSGFIGGDTLNFTNQSGITGSYDAVHGILTLSGTASLADYQTALDSIAYSFSPTNGDPTGGGGDTARTVSWVVNDGSTSNGVSTTGTSTLDTVHVAPTVTAGGTVTFIGGGSAVTLDSTLAVGDVDSAGNLAGATVSISSGFIGGDTLNFTNQSGITGSYDAVHGILTLSGTASLADYQTALDSIAYSFSPSNGDPTGGGGDTARTVSWVVNDGSTSNGVSTTGTSTLDTVHVAPTVTVPNGTTFTQNQGPVVLDSNPLTPIVVSDPDSSNLLVGATAQITGGLLNGDVLSATTTGTAITASYSNGVLTLTGTDTLADYQQVLASITFDNPTNPNPSNDGTDLARTISWSVTDGNTGNGVSTVQTSTVTVHAVPTIIAGADVNFQANYEGQTATLDPPLQLYAGANLSGATVSIVNGFTAGDTLAAVTAGTSVHASYDPVHGILTLSGNDTIADYEKVLASITFSGHQVSNGTVAIDWQATDQNNVVGPVASSEVDVTGVTAAPIFVDNLQGFLIPTGHGNGNSPTGGFFQVPIDLQIGPDTFVFTWQGFGFGSPVNPILIDIDAAVGANGGIDFSVPLGALEAALDGDLVSLTATLPNGQPLPGWLHFDPATGKFSGQAPSGSGAPATLAIEVIGRDYDGDMSVIDFTIKLVPAKGDHHSWNLPGDLKVLPATNTHDRHALSAPHRNLIAPTDYAALKGGSRPSGLDGTVQRPPGRAGLSAQLDGLGWRAMHGDRTALLDSLRRAAGGHG